MGRAAGPTPFRVAVVGAGIAGLVCARALAGHGLAITVVDKGRRPGGRVATRQVFLDAGGALAFNHGAQYLTATDDRFRRFVDGWRADGLVDLWPRHIDHLADVSGGDGPDRRERFAGVPSMNALAAHLAADLNVLPNTRVVAIRRRDGLWRLGCHDGADLGPFDGVVVAVPSPQAVPLLADAAPDLAEAAACTVMAPCWATLLAFERPLGLSMHAASVGGGGALAWIARDGSTLGRSDAETWVLHASVPWSRSRLEDDAAAVARDMTHAFAAATGADGSAPVHQAAHRWRFARVERPVGVPCLFDPDGRIGACGDWCLGPRIESAFLSGTAMADRFLADAAADCSHETPAS